MTETGACDLEQSLSIENHKKNNYFILPAKASPIALPRLELKYELTAINDDGFMNPSPRPNLEYLEEGFLLVSLSFQE